MQLAHQSSKLLITGSSGTGKSTYYLRYIGESRYTSIFVYDHEGEYSLRTGIQPVSNVEGISQAIHRKQRFIVYDPSEMFPGDSETGLEFFSRFVFEVCQTLPGTKLFAVDEIQKVVDSHNIPNGLRQILQTGRRRGLDFVCVCQQVNELHNKIRAQLTRAVVFQTVEKLSLQWFRPWYRPDFNEQTLVNLKRGCYADVILQGLGAGTIAIRKIVLKGS